MQTNSKRKFINVNFTMSYEEYDQGFTMPEFHFHNDYEVYVLVRGERTISIDGTEDFLTVAGDAVFFAREELHKSKGEEGFAGVCIHFSERFLKRYFTESAIKKIMEIFHVRKIHLNAEHLAIIQKITEEFVIDDECNFLRFGRLFEILHACLNEANSDKMPMDESTKNKFISAKHSTSKDKKSTQIFTYVNENYTYIKNLKEVAESFQISESYLFKLYQNEYGMTPKTYINKLKIKNICHSLKYSEATVKSIAAAYGFESYEHFCRVFKKEMGCTPTEYRRKLYSNSYLPLT